MGQRGTRALDWEVRLVSHPHLSPPSLTGRRSFEKRINSFPNYKADIEHDGQYQVHFMGLFSEKEDAQPIIMTHGWPGTHYPWLL